ncbi:Cytochrome c oxidase subunit 1 [Commensalibacter sp. Nvir]|uniref:cbb3-type cytochrome c oxidase subunit I n=1 Tax=Commensalibacter sp. Nvir TaxID=3069817 RepID=UPI002D73C4C6|nr:Cytochrome c oxidase subunit 1 [Commensalibacter sp. Nvir]
MSCHYRLGMGALLLAVLAGTSGSLAILLYKLTELIPALHLLLYPNHLQELSQVHARMMIFYCLQPALIVGFGNWFIPALISSNRMLFPTVNTFAFLLLSIGFIFNFTTFFDQDPSLVITSLLLWSAGNLLFSIVVLITIINGRARGVAYSSLSFFVWGQVISAFISLMIIPIFLAVLTHLYMSPILISSARLALVINQFIYPCMIILMVPALSIVFNILSTLSSKPVRFKGWVVGLLGFVIINVVVCWQKKIFLEHFAQFHQHTRVGTLSADLLYILFFLLQFYLLFKFVCGRLRFFTPVLWCIGFMVFMVIGWLYQGVTFSLEQIHSCLSYALLMSVFAGFYFWMGKIIGRMYSENLGKCHFFITFIGSLFLSNLISLGKISIMIGVVFMCASLLAFILVILNALRNNIHLPNNYWGRGAITPEWNLSSPLSLNKEIKL